MTNNGLPWDMGVVSAIQADMTAIVLDKGGHLKQLDQDQVIKLVTEAEKLSDDIQVRRHFVRSVILTNDLGDDPFDQIIKDEGEGTLTYSERFRKV